jgi:mitogen-activated protein kinase kinase kinase
LIVQIEHENLILYHNIEVFPTSCNIVAELNSGGSLRSLIKDFNNFEETLLRAYIFQICDGIKFLHSSDMTHGNLNSQNLLLDVYGVIKLSDYGNMNQLLETYAIKIVSAELESLYSEQIRNTGTESCDLLDLLTMKQNDILGIGCTVYEMVTGEVINSSNQNFKQFLIEIRGED